MTTTRTRTRKSDTLLFILARTIHEQILTQRAEYDASVEEWFRAGDGRSARWLPVDEHGNVCLHGVDGERLINFGGRGHRFPYCRHGANQHVDHDIPCGACEQGDDEPMVMALYQADVMLRLFMHRSDIIKPLIEDPYFPPDVRKSLLDWAWEAIDRGLKRPGRAELVAKRVLP